MLQLESVVLRSGDRHVTSPRHRHRHHLPILLLVRPEAAAEVPVSAKTLIVMIGSYPDCHTRTRVTCHVSSVDMHGQIGTLLAEINKDIVLIQHNDNI